MNAKKCKPLSLNMYFCTVLQDSCSYYLWFYIFCNSLVWMINCCNQRQFPNGHNCVQEMFFLFKLPFLLPNKHLQGKLYTKGIHFAKCQMVTLQVFCHFLSVEMTPSWKKIITNCLTASFLGSGYCPWEFSHVLCLGFLPFPKTVDGLATLNCP